MDEGQRPLPGEVLAMKTAAIPVSRLQSPSASRLARRPPGFVTRTKSRVTVHAIFAVLAGMIMAPGHLDAVLGSIAVLAIAAALQVSNFGVDID
jgi:heme O synthase-like polyprenyltransferase